MIHQEIWDTAKASLKKDIPSHAFNTWIVPIRPVAFSDNKLLLEVPNQFFFEWLDTHYKEIIEKKVVDKKGKRLKIDYTISAETKRIKNEADDEVYKPKHLERPPAFINKNQRFSNFIEGSNNQFAKAAAASIAKNPGASNYNPLVIYGGVGLGKTHLLHAIGNLVMSNEKKRRVVLETSERFTQEFINSIQKNITEDFTKKYRKADVLLIDDIQFFKGKEQTQEQFFHTFNELHQLNKQIVLSADTYPGDMEGLQERLVSRFQSGLSVDIQPPDLETRIAILMNKAKNENLDIPYDVTEFIATSIQADIRSMEGALVKLLAIASLKKEDITIDLSKKVIEDILGEDLMNQVTIENICSVVAGELNVPENQLGSQSRKMELVNARHIAMYLSRELTNNSLLSIGKYFGDRDHSTVIHGCKTIEKKLKENSVMNNVLTSIKNKLL